MTTDSLLQPYVGHVRVRVGGLLTRANAVLLAGHRGLLPQDVPFWSPPGGGWHFGETLHEALVREFREETGLAVRVGELLHLHEFLNPAAGLQALELFFAVEALDDAALPRLGHDPEHAPHDQLLTELRWFNPPAWRALPPAQLHPVVRGCLAVGDLYMPQRLLA